MLRRTLARLQGSPQHHYHQCLGLQQGHRYTSGELKKAFFAKAKELHPDVGGDPKQFLALREAYEALRNDEGSDSDRRRGKVNTAQPSHPQAQHTETPGSSGNRPYWESQDTSRYHHAYQQHRHSREDDPHNDAASQSSFSSSHHHHHPHWGSAEEERRESHWTWSRAGPRVNTNRSTWPYYTTSEFKSYRVRGAGVTDAERREAMWEKGCLLASIGVKLLTLAAAVVFVLDNWWWQRRVDRAVRARKQGYSSGR